MATLKQLPAPLDLSFIAGDEFNFTLRFRAPSGTTTVPLDLTGYTITAVVFVSRVRAGATSPPAIGSTLFTPGLTIDRTGGTVVVSISETNSALLQNPDVLAVRWYVRWVSPGGVTRTVSSGSVAGGTP